MKVLAEKKKILKMIFAVSLPILLLLWNVPKRDKTITTIDIHEIHPQIKFQTSPNITIEDLHYLISVLASDTLEGRAAGTSGEKKTIDFITEKFSDYGLDYRLQPFTFLNRELIWYDCTLSFGSFQGELNRDFRSLIRMNSSFETSGEVVFVGYGYANDYKNFEARGKWVMIFEGTPFDNVVPRAKQSLDERYDIAQKKSAIGVLAICSDSTTNRQIVPRGVNFGPLYIGRTTSSKFPIPLIRISGKTADSIFQYAGRNTSDALKNVSENIQIPIKVYGAINSRSDSLVSNNIIAYMEGADSLLKKEYIIVGAHYDALGMQTFPIITGDSTIIFYGANDNASGTAGVMELAEKLVSVGNLKRSIVFILFGAEEHSLMGSRYFCNNFPVPHDNIKLMINLDMIGQMDSLKKTYIYTDTSNSLLLNKLCASHPDISLIFDTNSRMQSDHRSFVLKKIPVAYFTTGYHQYYHTPRDNLNLIYFEELKQLLEFIYDFICLKAETIAN